MAAVSGATVQSLEESMKSFWVVAALPALVLLAIDTAGATVKHRHRHYAAPVAVAPTSSFAPARMIEVRPGVIISSYDCIIDEGYGRYRRCSDGKK
jgi:hypothetical protein